MVEKSKFSDLTPPPLVPTEKACGNCFHARDEPADSRMIRCKAFPPTVVPVVVEGQIALRSEWPALRRTQECDSFKQKTIDGSGH